MDRTIIAVLWVQLLCLVGPAHAASQQGEESADSRPAPGGMLIEPTRRMHGERMPWQHEIQIALPRSYHQTTKAYPVLWVTDGQQRFDTAVRAVALAGKHIPEMIVVAIGAPPEDWKESYQRRAYDFTPTQDWRQFDSYDKELVKKAWQTIDEGIRNSGYVVPTNYGGASVFLAFLVDTVRPALAKDYRMADSNTLVGHSAGGVFCTFALLQAPESFDKYLCLSPAVFGGNGFLLRKEVEYARTHADLKADVFVGVGEAEASQIEGMAAVGNVSSAARMVEMLNLRRYPSLHLHFRVFQAEEHGTVPPVGMYWGLRALWQSQDDRSTGAARSATDRRF